MLSPMSGCLRSKQSLGLEVGLQEKLFLTVFIVVQLLSRVQLFSTPWTAAHQASLSFTISQSLLKLMSTELVMPSNHLILCHPLLLPPSIFPTIRVFSNQSVVRIRQPKYWSFSNRPSNEYSGLISFRIDWLFPKVFTHQLINLLSIYHVSSSVLGAGTPAANKNDTLLALQHLPSSGGGIECMYVCNIIMIQ